MTQQNYTNGGNDEIAEKRYRLTASEILSMPYEETSNKVLDSLWSKLHKMYFERSSDELVWWEVIRTISNYKPLVKWGNYYPNALIIAVKFCYRCGEDVDYYFEQFDAADFRTAFSEFFN